MQDRPNILVIMSDQHACRRIGCYGDPTARTPNIDRLAAKGMRFDSAYCPAPVCVPSRMSFMTGRKPSDINVIENFDILSSITPTWAAHAGRAGYETALIGRMHFEGPDQYHGFDFVHPDFVNWKGTGPRQQFIYTAKVPVDNYWSERNSIENSGSGKTYVQFNDERVCSASCDYLKEHSQKTDKPFAAVVGFYMPHPPYVGRTDLFMKYFNTVQTDNSDEMAFPEYLRNYFKDFRSWWIPGSMDKNKIRMAMASYYAMIEQLDSLIGTILDSLKKNNLAENTVVIYVSDHGDMSSVKNSWGKLLFYEESVKVPLVIRYPGRINPGSVCSQVCNLRDLSQTLCSIAGAEPLSAADARSLEPLFSGKSSAWENYTESEICLFPIIRQKKHAACKMVRYNEWKLWCYIIEGKASYSLFNLKNDPFELHDLIGNASCTIILEKLKIHLHQNWDHDRILNEAIQRKKDRGMTAGNLESRGIPSFSFPANLDETIKKDHSHAESA
ncbi:MAG: hypothetical protein A2096_01820 [Spirochaetes bacterium GWF1_41_5]|nr:MAG: hypothetical protein A2096_01820 [Spirochaetes bacterium GWF1_41_5]HBE02756.1 hypothetical protein [Spirochaetia bacterium]